MTKDNIVKQLAEFNEQLKQRIKELEAEQKKLQELIEQRDKEELDS